MSGTTDGDGASPTKCLPPQENCFLIRTGPRFSPGSSAKMLKVPLHQHEEWSRGAQSTTSQQMGKSWMLKSSPALAWSPPTPSSVDDPPICSTDPQTHLHPGSWAAQTQPKVSPVRRQHLTHPDQTTPEQLKFFRVLVRKQNFIRSKIISLKCYIKKLSCLGFQDRNLTHQFLYPILYLTCCLRWSSNIQSLS